MFYIAPAGRPHLGKYRNGIFKFLAVLEILFSKHIFTGYSAAAPGAGL